ncbi:MAG: hypothetical protein A2Y62_04140 [Candidatus Fischerbacteria bacterium RBG_13_37_8]|uniref:Uncharacterized protein n=1 Tax=Candidatus Fischerbacteria bacterium RBG_13_37_8 TaxID=1817863 RepID=A0A1F5V5B9_9BACT|nr:MAG: hypothetical protein A2Y62_04140 [Candidatus Fischerbacteria bacterium RBG_13_37_8]
MVEPLDEVSKSRYLCHQNRGVHRFSGISTEETCLLSVRCPGHRRHELYFGLLCGNAGNCITMLRERHKMRTIEADSTEALYSSGLSRSSEEAPVMGVERRAGVIRLGTVNNHIYGRIY